MENNTTEAESVTDIGKGPSAVKVNLSSNILNNLTTDSAMSVFGANAGMTKSVGKIGDEITNKFIANNEPKNIGLAPFKDCQTELSGLGKNVNCLFATSLPSKAFHILQR